MKVLTLKEAKERGLIENLKKNLDNLDVLTRTKTCIKNRFGARCPLGAIIELQEGELRKVEGFGPKSYKDLESVVRELGLSLHVRLTDALKREIGAPIKDDDPHENVLPSSINPIKELEREWNVLDARIEQADADIRAMQKLKNELEQKRSAIRHVIDSYATIALALSS